MASNRINICFIFAVGHFQYKSPIQIEQMKIQLQKLKIYGISSKMQLLHIVCRSIVITVFTSK